MVSKKVRIPEDFDTEHYKTVEISAYVSHIAKDFI